MIKKIVALLLLGATLNAHAVLIDFDDLDASGGPVVVSDHYAALGVTFTPFSVVENPVFNVSAPNVGLVFTSAIFANFDNVVQHVSLTMFDTEIGSLLGMIAAYDGLNGSGAVLDVAAMFSVDGAANAGGTGVTLSLNAPNIRSISIVSDGDGATWDNFAFQVPEPASAALALLGTTLVAMRRRRTTPHAMGAWSIAGN